jgi:hypothetical protein
MQGLDNDKFVSLQEQITQDQKENEASKHQIACWKNTHQMINHKGIWWKEDRIVVARDTI